MSVDFLKTLGLDLDKLSPEELESFQRVTEKLGKKKLNQKTMLEAIRKAGIDIRKIRKKLMQKQKPKESVRIGRNDKCLCDSGKKWKKCCGSNTA